VLSCSRSRRNNAELAGDREQLPDLGGFDGDRQTLELQGVTILERLRGSVTSALVVDTRNPLGSVRGHKESPSDLAVAEGRRRAWSSTPRSVDSAPRRSAADDRSVAGNFDAERSSSGASRDFQPRKSSEGYLNLDARGVRGASFRVRRRRPRGSWPERRAGRSLPGAGSGSADGSRPWPRRRGWRAVVGTHLGLKPRAQAEGNARRSWPFGGAFGGGLGPRPCLARSLAIASGLVAASIHCMTPPQRGQVVTSISNT